MSKILESNENKSIQKIADANTTIDIILNVTAPTTVETESVKTIGDSAFEKCSSLTSVTIDGVAPDGVAPDGVAPDGVANASSDEETIDLEHYKEIMFDFDNEIEDRVDAFLRWQQEPNDIILEITNKLCTMYLFSGSSMIKEFLINLINTAGVRDIIKIELAKTLCTYDESFDNFNVLDSTLQYLEDVPIVILINCVQLLMKSKAKNHQTNSLEYFKAIINNVDYDQYFRYRTILSLEFHIGETSSNYYIRESLFAFLTYPHNTSTYRILSGQALLQKYYRTTADGDDEVATDTITQERRDSIQQALSSIMNDPDLDINVRADAADVLLNLGDGIFVQNAQEIIILLGAVDGAVRTVYQDGQNTHNQEIEASAVEILEKIDTVENNLTFDKAKKYIMDIIGTEGDEEGDEEGDDSTEGGEEGGEEGGDADTKKKVTIALNRINVDRQLYSQYNISLKGILLRVITFINLSEHKDELQQRLVEELIDMHAKCSSGFAFRLINTLSGYCEHTIRISWADQIAGNLLGRLNARIRNIEDEQYQADVLVEMSLSDSTISNRKNFLKFFREALPWIREELWEIFKEDMTDTEFDLYLRRAISKYEGHDWL